MNQVLPPHEPELIISFERMKKGLYDLRVCSGEKISEENADEVAKKLNELANWQAYAATLFGSAVYHYKSDPKDPEKAALKELAEKLFSANSTRCKALTSILSRHKEERRLMERTT